MNKKNEEQPHAPRFAFDLAPRCGAKTRQRSACKSPSVRGKNRCRMHGGSKGSGAPINNTNALKNGLYTKEVKFMKLKIKSTLARAENVLKHFR